MFARPKGIAIDADGHVYVADSVLNRLQVFSPEGKPLLSFSGTGWGPAQFMLMAGLAIDSRNRIIAVDQMPARIEVFHYTTDAEAAAAKEGRKAPEMGPTGSRTPAPDKAPHEPQPMASPAASPGPTVEELQKELADLKAKLRSSTAAEARRRPERRSRTGQQTGPGSTKFAPLRGSKCIPFWLPGQGGSNSKGRSGNRTAGP